MRRLSLLVAALLALAAQGQEAPDAGEAPAPAEPTSAEPTSAEPTSAEPTSAEPTSAEPPSAEPPSAEPPSAEPQLPESAVTPEPEAPSFLHKVEANGYLSLRGGFTRSKVGGLIDTADQPQLAGLAELNGQLKVSFRERSFVYADVSLIAQAAGNFRGVDKDGNEIPLAEHDTPANRPLVSINELYALHEFLPELNVMLGKKRLVWGSGQAFNPTDLLNVRKDPTDPTFQRSGAWLARVEVPLETLVFTAVFAPGVLKQVNGLPQQLLTWPGWDPKDTELHYLAAFRAYALVADSDVNLMAFFSNLSGDAFKNKFRFGASFSRYFFTDYELHTEFLIQSGSSRDYITPECVVSGMAALACNSANKSFLGKSRLDDSALYPKVLVGTRRAFDDESFLSIEYLYQADGYTRGQYQDLINALDLVQEAKALGVPANRLPNLNPAVTGDGLPQRFTFEPLMQHYLFLTYSKPRIFDDFTAQLVTIVNLQDLSTIWTPSLAWSTTEWLTLSAIGFIPVQGLDSLSAKRMGSEKRVSEYSNLPLSYRVVLEARVFY